MTWRWQMWIQSLCATRSLDTREVGLHWGRTSLVCTLRSRHPVSSSPFFSYRLWLVLDPPMTQYKQWRSLTSGFSRLAVPPKPWHVSTKLHGITPRKTIARRWRQIYLTDWVIADWLAGLWRIYLSGWKIGRLVGWLMTDRFNWLIGRLADWFNGWLMNDRTDWQTDWLAGLRMTGQIGRLIHWLVYDWETGLSDCLRDSQTDWLAGTDVAEECTASIFRVEE
jgi:hypothetical protein